MKVVYENLMKRVAEAAEAATRDGRDIKHIEMNSDEMDQLYDEMAAAGPWLAPGRYFRRPQEWCVRVSGIMIKEVE